MASLSRQFAEREVSKVYVADVVGCPPADAGSLALPLSPDPSRQPRQRVDFGSTGKACLTRWSVVGKHHSDQRLGTRVKLEPHTGRRHQLRVHMAAAGCAIAGDALYSEPLPAPPPSSAHEDALAQTCVPSPTSTAGSPAAEASQRAEDLALTDPSKCMEAASAGDCPSSQPQASDDNSLRAGVVEPVTRLHLHACELTLCHPSSGEWMTFRSEPPFRLEDAVGVARWAWSSCAREV
eukprot:7382367-Prymnesium_polylepis.1